MSVLAIDFDGVLHDDRPEVRTPGKRMGPPIEGARAAMEELRDAGHELIIHTVRGSSPQHVEDWLDYFVIPFDSVTNIKPKAHVYLDDRAVRFEGSWMDAYVEIMSALHAEG